MPFGAVPIGAAPSKNLDRENPTTTTGEAQWIGLSNFHT